GAHRAGPPPDEPELPDRRDLHHRRPAVPGDQHHAAGLRLAVRARPGHPHGALTVTLPHSRDAADRPTMSESGPQGRARIHPFRPEVPMTPAFPFRIPAALSILGAVLLPPAAWAGGTATVQAGQETSTLAWQTGGPVRM